MAYYPFLQNGNNQQNGWQGNGQNWQGYGQNNMQDNGLYGFQRMPMNYQQMRSMMSQPVQPSPQGSSKIDRVNGKEGAEAYFLMPNSEILLLDTTNPIIWLKQTDSAGYGTVQLRAIDNAKFEAAQNTALINANITDKAQKIIDTLNGNQMAMMRDQIQNLTLQNMMNGVVRYPMASTYTAGANPFCNCGNFNGCCCN